MRIGLQKTSLVDFPGRVAAVLFMAGCGFRCPYCHNPGLVLTGGSGDGGSARGADGLISLEEAMAFLERRKDVLSGAVISGGEPTMHADLPSVVAAVRGLGYLVKLDTNGANPDRIAAAGADYIAMDLKTSPERYGELWPGAPLDAATRIRRSVAAVRGSGAQHEFRITCAPGLFEEADAEAVAALLEPGDRVYLQRYRPGRVLDGAWAASVSPHTEEKLAVLLAIVATAAPLAKIRGL